WITTSGGAAGPGASASWSWGAAGIDWTGRDQHRFKVESKAKDRAGNEETSFGSTEFWWDVTNPLSDISVPQDGANLNSLTTVSGTA
ncbi:MAG: hypothetical protein COY50_10360, partial [Deltaproteobacteria bacterium CG_4_10_14_0_8_um_filter_43_12]